MNELIYQPEPRKAPLRCLPSGRLLGPSIDHQLTPCQEFLSLSTEPVVLLEMKDAKRSFPNEASSGPVWVDRSGIAGGHPAKRPPNFGPDRVVYAYPALHYPKWRAEFPSLAVAFHAGVFGESFTLTGVNEETVCIGDIIRVGSCHLQLSEPGQPNQWPYASRRRMIIEAAKRTNRTGWYYRIIEPGWVTASYSVVLVKRHNPSWSVTRFSQILGAEDPTRKELAELTTLKGLASDWQWAAGKALKGVEQSLALFRGR
jgi:MOSC domain-containing protein YiiM